MSVFQRIRYARFWPMLWKEFIQMRRDRLMLAMMTGLPAVQLILFGYAIQTEVRHLPTVILAFLFGQSRIFLVEYPKHSFNIAISSDRNNAELSKMSLDRTDQATALADQKIACTVQQ